MIFPDEKVIEILTLENGEYLEFSKSRKKGIAKSKILAGLEIDSKDIFN